MTRKLRSLFACALLCACGTVSHAATVLEVTHSPALGQYGSISAALTDAVNGDTIEIIDNSAPYNDSIFFNSKTNITIQGAAGLDPKPTLVGVANTYHVVGEQGTYPNGATISGDNANYGNHLKNLVIDGRANSMVVDVRFAIGSMNNVAVVMGPTNKVGLLSAEGNISMTSCTLSGNPEKCMEHWGGIVTMNQVHAALTGGNVLNVYKGKLDATNCSFVSPADNVLKTSAFNELGGGIEINLTNCLLRSTSPTGVVSVLLNFDRITPTHSQQHVSVIDNCDFIGSRETSPTTTVSSIAFNVVMDSVVIRDSIFHHTLYGPMSNNIATGNVGEDYNIFKQTNYNDGGMAGISKGTHSLVLGDTDKLYADDLGAPYVGDFRLDQLSAAATLNSTGTPAYAGSQGLHPVVPVELSALALE